MNYKDLGYSDYLNSEPNIPNFIGAPNTLFLEGVDAGQVLSLGKIQSPTGKWYIDFTNEEVSLPENSVKSRSISYQSRGYKAVVSQTGGGDFSDIQDAIDYVNRNGGGTIYIKEGTYLQYKTIQLYTKIGLVGAGSGKTVIDFSGIPYDIGRNDNGFEITGDLTDFSLAISYDDRAFQNISFDNLSIKFPYRDDNQYAIFAQYVRNLNITNCIFEGCFDCIYVGNCYPANINNCTFVGKLGGASFGTAIEASGSYCVISNNIFSYINYGVILSNSSGGTIVSENFFESMKNSAIYVAGGGPNIIIHGNVFNGIGTNNQLIRIGYLTGVATRNVTITDNFMYDNLSGTEAAIDTLGESTSNPNTSMIINGNNIYGFYYGVILRSTDLSLVNSNRIDACTVGLSIDANSDRNIYDGNNLMGCTTKVSNAGTNTTAGSNIIA